MKAILLNTDPDMIARVYEAETLTALAAEAGLFTEKVFDKADIPAHPEIFADTEIIFSTWGMPSFSEEEIKTGLPRLTDIYYAAGSVKGFAEPFLACGVRVHSASAANAVPVAEVTVAQILLANKGFFRSSSIRSRADYDAARRIADRYPGNYGVSVGIIGAGMIGKLVIGRLKSHDLSVMVFDPFLSEADAAELGVRKCDLKTIFRECRVVSNHLANVPETVGMLTGDLFRSLPSDAVFINTGRGAQVVESDLAAVLRERPDLTALLDVTDPEPPTQVSPLYTLDNVILTPHIAGSGGNEVCRMSRCMREEFLRVKQGEPPLWSVSPAMLETMA